MCTGVHEVKVHKKDHLQEHQSFNKAWLGEAGVGGWYPHLLVSPEQWHKAERGIMMSGNEESKSFTLYE